MRRVYHPYGTMSFEDGFAVRKTARHRMDLYSDETCFSQKRSEFLGREYRFRGAVTGISHRDNVTAVVGENLPRLSYVSGLPFAQSGRLLYLRSYGEKEKEGEKEKG